MYTLLLLTAPAPVQILDVHPTLGPYFEISGAIAAASDGDVIRVADGLYLPFIIDGLGISIVPLDADPDITVQGPVRIGNIGTGESVSVSGLSISGVQGSFDTPLSVANSDGSVRIQDCDVLPTAVTPGVVLESAMDVVVINTVVTFGGSGDGGAGISAARSILSLFNVTANGGHTSWTGGSGSAAIALFDSTVFASACMLVGGDGGPGYSDGSFTGFQCIIEPGNGGAGMLLLGGSSVTALGCDVTSGFPGVDWNFFCTGGFRPPSFTADGSSTATEVSGLGPELHCPSRQSLGSPFPFSITAESTDFVMLAASPRSARVDAPGATGSFLLDTTPGQIRRINLGVGPIQSSIDIPAIPSLIGATWSFQTGHVRAGSLVLGPVRTVVFL